MPIELRRFGEHELRLDRGQQSAGAQRRGLLDDHRRIGGAALPGDRPVTNRRPAVRHNRLDAESLVGMRDEDDDFRGRFGSGILPPGWQRRANQCDQHHQRREFPE
ncbi:MAG: hypothetical protein U0703_01790 [Anaerolineae bacterium]